MPIKGLSDRGLAFPEIGQIRKGAPKIEGKNVPGKDLKYFRVTFDEQEVEASTTFNKVYGDKPDAIHVILPFNEIEKMWESWLEAYTAGRMVARSDGEYFVYLVDTKTGEILIKNGLDKDGKQKPYLDKQVVGLDYKNNEVKCKPVGRLKVIVPELARAAYMTVLTTSINDIVNISEQLAAFKELNNGQIAGIPLVLRRRPKMISRPGEGAQRIRTEKWLLSIEADPAWVRAKLTQVKRLALPGNGLSQHEAELPESTLPEDDDEYETQEEMVDSMATEIPEVSAEVHDPLWKEPEPPIDMPLSQAILVLDDGGKAYNDMSTDFLEDIFHKMTEAITAPVISSEYFKELNFKLNAISVILRSREVEAEPELPLELQRAMEMAGQDGKKYGEIAVFEINRKIKVLNERLKVETDAKNQSMLLNHVDALKLVLKYRMANQPEKNKV